MPQSPCPYCGHPNDRTDVGRCTNCNGLFEPLSQIATQLAMGPWFVRDEDRPFMPGFSLSIMQQQIRSGRINANTIVRGPTTHQFWVTAANAPGISRLMGTCHACHQAVEPTDTACPFCRADLSLPEEVDQLGLRYTSTEQRALAQQEVAQGRVLPPPKPMPQAVVKPTRAKTMKGSTIVDPSLLKPVEQTKPSTSNRQAPAIEPEQENEQENPFGEDLWQAGPTTGSRRRKRQKGVDPLVLVLSVALLCVIALGGLIVLTGGDPDDAANNNTSGDNTNEPSPTRDLVAVSRVSIPALTAVERLQAMEIPAAFTDRYNSLRRLADKAQADKEAERFDEAYKAYTELSALASPLEDEIAQWQVNEQAKAQAVELRERVLKLRSAAQEAQAPRWAATEWLEAQTALDQAEPLFSAAKFAQAGELYAQAESTYLIVESKAQAGQVAGNALKALSDAIAQSSEASLKQYAKDLLDKTLRLRADADQQLKDEQYAQAEQSYLEALDTLKQAQQAVEVTKYRKFYAFDAGFRASGLMLAAARGDGVDATAQQELSQLFEKLRILPNPAKGITPGNDVGFTVAIEPLINVARDAIRQQHGEDVQACYLIGFHVNLIDQTLLTKTLTDEQQKRIHQSLGTIETAAQTAGWNLTTITPMIDQVRTLNRNASLKAEPTSTRDAWQKVISPLRTRDSATDLMQPVTPSQSPKDPDLFPKRN